MADLTDQQSAQTVKLTGANSSGVEDNYLEINTNGSLNVAGATAVGAAPTNPPVAVSGTDGGGLKRSILTDTTGAVRIDPTGTTSQPVIGVTGGVPLQTLPLAPASTDSYPNSISAYPLANATGFSNDYNLTLDVFDNLQIRGPVITDEGSFRDDFSGSSLYTALSGTVKFLTNSAAVTGVATSFTTQVNSSFYIKAVADAESFLTQIDYVQDDGTLYMTSNYGANENNVAAHTSRYKISTAATGGTTSVANSILSLSSGTANGGTSSIQNVGDYLPYVLQFYTAITQRIANQTTIVGFQDNPASPNKQAIVQFDGTSNTTVKFITSFSSAAADTQTTTVTLPGGANTASFNLYEIDLGTDTASFFINGQLAVVHTTHLPGPYDVLTVSARMTNSAVVTATTLQLDYILWNNVDRINVVNDFAGNPIPTTSNSIYNTTLPNAVAGAPVSLQSNQFGELSVVSRNKFRNLAGAGTTTVKSGSGKLHTLVINAAASSSTVTLYDNTAASGTKIATVSAPIVGSSLLYDIEFSTGLTVVVTNANTDVTVSYQ